MAENDTHAGNKQQSQPEKALAGQITPQLVQQVVDKVYALLLAERRIGQERQRNR